MDNRDNKNSNNGYNGGYNGDYSSGFYDDKTKGQKTTGYATGVEYEHIENPGNAGDPNFVIMDYSADNTANSPADNAAPNYNGYSNGSGGNGGPGGPSGPGGYQEPAGGKRHRTKRPKKDKVPMQITKKAFVLVLILCMVVTSAVTFGGMALYSNYMSNNSGEATNYTLSKSTETLSYKSIISKTENSVVSITTESVSTDTWAQNYVTEGAGSGVIIQSNGYIITCNHVISGASKITVTLKNKKTYKAKVVGTDSTNDIAVLKINATGLTAATYGDSSSLQVGDQVIAIGNPLGQLGGTATTGIISALNRSLTIEGQSMNLLQTDASINPGNSGGALFNSSGNLIGIVVAKSTGSDVEGLGFAIPINKAAKVAKNLIKNGGSSSSSSTTSSKAAIGVTVTALTESEAQQNGYSSAGVYISSVTSSNAQSAGLKSGDMIYSIGGTRITTTTTLKTALSKYSPGDKAKLVIIRDNQKVSITVTLTTASN